MSVIGSIKQLFQHVAESKEDQLHQAQEGDKPPEAQPKGGVGDTPTTVQDAKPEQDWPGDT